MSQKSSYYGTCILARETDNFLKNKLYNVSENDKCYRRKENKVRKDRSGKERGGRGARQGGRVAILHGMGQVNHTEKVLSEQTQEASDGVSQAGVWGRSVSGRGNTQECVWCA